jgi:L-threonylcarbamoyladenylate synthase
MTTRSQHSSTVDEAVEAIQAGKPVILPADTLYGLCASPYSEACARRLYKAKGREETKPTALLAADLDWLFECIPELRGRAGVIARVLLPGPYTLVLPNPARRYRWLTGMTPEAIGVRVPELPEPTAQVLARVGAVAATSANLPGGPDPRRLDEVPEEIQRSAAAAVDVGELPGTPSTVLDFTGPEPRVLREGAAPAAEALERVAAAVGG